MKHVGAVRDVIENHLLQVVVCLAMDAPSSGHPETLRDQKARLLASATPPHEYQAGGSGLPDADRLVVHFGGWDKPQPAPARR